MSRLLVYPTLLPPSQYVDTIEGSPVVEIDSVRRSAINYVHKVDAEPPVSLQATAELPPAGQPGRLLNARIGLSPFTIVPRISCSSERFNGVYRAHVTLDSLPPWIRPGIRDAQAVPDVCNARGGFRLSIDGGWKSLSGVGALGLLIGAILF